MKGSWVVEMEREDGFRVPHHWKADVRHVEESAFMSRIRLDAGAYLLTGPNPT